MIVERIEELHRAEGTPYRTLCTREGLSRASFMRWKQRGERGAVTPEARTSRPICRPASTPTLHGRSVGVSSTWIFHPKRRYFSTKRLCPRPSPTSRARPSTVYRPPIVVIMHVCARCERYMRAMWTLYERDTISGRLEARRWEA